jgi:hypothetical protein
MTEWNNKSFVLVLSLTAAARLSIFFITGFTADDAFITYRFADNLAQGRGFAYNPGEVVQGTSTPLYTIILAGFSAVCGSQALPWVSRGIGVAADLCALMFIIRATGPLGGTAQFLSAWMFALFPRLVFCSSLGMETPLVVLMMMASYDTQQRGKIGATGWILGLLFLVRADTLLWSILILAMIVRKEGRSSVRTLLPFAMPIITWGVFAYMTFGSVIPHAVEAKAVSWHHLYGPFEPVRVLLGYFPFHELNDFPTALTWALCLLALLPVILVLPHLYRRRDPLIIFPVFFLLYNLVFSAARVVMADWYYPPAWAAYVVSLGAAWSWLFNKSGIAEARESLEQLFRRMVVPVLMLLLALAVYRWRRDPGDWFRDELVSVGSWLKTNAPVNSSVMLEPIGVIGWISGLYIHDEVGLVSPQVLEYRKRFEGSDSWFFHYIQEIKPTYIVLQSREIQDNLLFLGHGDGIFRTTTEREWFLSHYAESPRGLIPGSTGNRHYVIYGPFDEGRF